MCKKSLLMMLLLALFAPWAAKAQSVPYEVQIGEGTSTSGYFPFYTLYNYSIGENLFLASELEEAGVLPGQVTSLSWYATNQTGYEQQGISIWMANVDDEALTTTSHVTTDMTLVYTGSVTPVTGWNEFLCEEDTFTWDGTSNILIFCQRNNGAWNSTIYWQAGTVDFTAMSYKYQDGSAYDVTVPNTMSTSTTRPNIIIKGVGGGGTGPTCTKPGTLDVTDITGYTATCTWENTGAASYTFEWKKASDSDYTVVSGLTANTYALSSLEPMTAYSVRVKAVCGTDLESGYKTANFTTLDVCPDGKVCIGEGTATNSYLPTYNYYNYSLTEQIYTADEIGEAALIESVDIYSVGSVTRNLEIYMVNTEKITFDSVTDWIPATESNRVFSGSVAFAANSWNTMEFDNPFIYDGRHNVVLIVRDITGSYVSSINFFVFNAQGNQAIRAYRDTPGAYDIAAPGVNGTLMAVKNRVRFGVSELPSCLQPSGLTVSNIGARSVELSWTEHGEATAWQIGYQVVGGTEQYVEVSTNPYTLTGLTPDTDYEVRVQSKCSDTEYSTFTNFVSFTTEPSCYAPTDLVISDITAYSANVAWTSDNTNFDMRYTTDIDPNNDFETSFLRGWTNIDADGDGYVWVLGSESAGVYHSAGVDVTGTGHNSSYDFIISGSYTNAGSTALTPDNYLVSPQITLGGSISFWACAQDASYCEEHFGVAVSTTSNTDPDAFTTIAEWTITSESKGAVLREANHGPRGGNRAQTEWIQYTVDLSAYSGRGYVAIRHFNCTDMFLLNLDDIVVEQPGGFQPTWVDVTNPTNPQALTNLEPETDYIVQVRANCGDENGVSQWLEGSFTTLPACMVPTDLVISNVDKRSADLAWVSNGEEAAWQIMVNGDTENLIDVTETSYTLTDLEPDQTQYTVRVRAVCDETLHSDWSTPVTFYTLIACPAPTNLFISDIANISAVANWTGEGDFELQYAEDVWKYYDNGVFATTMGAGGTLYWGMMLPAESLTAGEPLTKVALHTSYAGEATLNVYLGGDQPTGTPAATQTFTMAGDRDFMEITLDTPVAIDGTQNLWITFYQSGLTYVADGCTGPTDPNGRWVSLDGETWADIAGYGYDYTWMIRAAFGNNTQTEWVTIDNATSPQAITGLTPETDYLVRVKHVCGGIDGESVWVTTKFTTDIACPAPEALGATPYALSAELSWEGVSESYTVRYGITEVGETLSSFDFEDETIPADFTNSTTYPWTVTEGGADESGYCVIPGNAGVNSSTSDLTLQVTGPCSVSFMAKVSSENNWDWGRFLIDGTQQMQISGTKDWESYSYTVAEGTHTLVWRYYKDSSSASGNDLFYVDNIVINEMSYAWETTTATTNECTITGLTSLTTYYAQVMGDCGDYGTSEWSEIISFTTTEDTCPVPTNLTVDAETLTFNTADLSWNGSPDVESFTVRYRAPQHAAEGALYETFGTSIPTGWTLYTGLLDTVMVRPSALTSATSGWNFGTGNGMFDNHARCNIYGNYQRWLVTPAVTVPADGNFTFDMALTVWSSSSSSSPTAGGQPDDKFIVLISTDSLQTWTILREWNNEEGAEYVYDEITNDANGQPVSIDLSAYVGQSVHIAFYGESTVSNGDNNLHIDNVLIGTLIPATDWQTVTTTDMNVTLTGLTPETTYEAQVKADCSDPEEWTNTVNFTTLEQTIPTQTVALEIGTNWVSFNVEITLNDLKAALVEALPGTTIDIKSRNYNTTYNPNNGRWVGRLTSLDINQMYRITVPTDCEIVLQGEMVDPAAHPITIIPGANWIAYPFTENMSLTNAFAGFAINGDQVKSRLTNATYTRGRWMGSLTTLESGKGYMYISTSSENRTFVFPTSAK